MMKRLLFILCLLPAFAFAQEETDIKYMAGAVPVVNGKVLFKKEIKAPNLSKDQIFDAVQAWANTRFKTEGQLGTSSVLEQGRRANRLLRQRTHGIRRQDLLPRPGKSELPGELHLHPRQM